MKILILCTKNSCRSQMAHGFLKSFNQNIEVHSAGTHPGSEVNTMAISVMSEIGIDISNHYPKPVDIYLNDKWDYVITVCDSAKETCPAFYGKVRHRKHLEFKDPSEATGSEEFIMSEFRRIRDQIKTEFKNFYNDKIKPGLI
jgi:arsenate reductase